MAKRGQILISVLKFLKDGAIDMIDLQGAILLAGYGASMGKIDKELKKIKDGRERDKIKRERIRKLSKYFWKLKNDGLIQENKKGKVALTNKGQTALKDLSNKIYEIEKSNNLIIVSFDIPEEFRRSRHFLREALKMIDFTMVHRSTWFGKNKIPPKLIAELEKKEILEFVKIFEVTKGGTLIDSLSK